VRVGFAWVLQGSADCDAVGSLSDMALVVFLLLLALVFGGAGLFVEGLKWALIVALILIVASAITGSRYR
jgi:CHASE2 domain-containing sensor protein